MELLRMLLFFGLMIARVTSLGPNVDNIHGLFNDGLDVSMVTEIWHKSSDSICLSLAKPRNFSFLGQNPRPVFTGLVSQSVGFRTTLACFHWAVKSGWLSHNQGPIFTGPVSQSVGFRTTLACFHWAVESGRLSHNQGPVFTWPVCQSVGFRTTLACFHWAVESGRLSHNQHKTTRVRTTLETNCVTLVRVQNYANERRVSYQIHF
ncbi:hypothetical protein HELRODRAFT_178500 [Helobdella robusta]|uniref:Uncharacterized protein n=1 Tax=Helobdella robusta TaxID=6412 RepID=T1FD97_HELRO|nr:hypothetical protein HELRODRAFT_178500 [Helobdella robusta]ESN97053.1 hypothetical protein HELRODRAFT_178500 [Helobdella robusta]